MLGDIEQWFISFLDHNHDSRNHISGFLDN